MQEPNNGNSPRNRKGHTLSLRFISAIFVSCAALVVLGGTAPLTDAAQPIKIAVIGPAQSTAGQSIINGAELAVSDINAAGGVNGRQIELFKFDSKGSATNAVRAWQKAVQQDHVVAGVGIYTSEVGLALEPWVGRYKTPFIDSASASPKITMNVHKNYKKLKYLFDNNLNSNQLAKLVCKALHDTVVRKFHASRAAILAENFSWTGTVIPKYQECLPKAGLMVTKTIKFSQNTRDFSSIYNTLAESNAQIIVTALADTGLRPTVQWRHKHVPALMAGINGQATDSNFWNRTNGATEGVISMNTGSTNGAAITSKTPAFYKAYIKRFGSKPSFAGYTTYDAVHMIAKAIGKANSTDSDAIVNKLESDYYEGVAGKYQFYGKESPLTHGVKFGVDYMSGFAFQWQNGQEVVVWPPKIAQGEVILPSFVKSVFAQK